MGVLPTVLGGRTPIFSRLRFRYINGTTPISVISKSPRRWGLTKQYAQEIILSFTEGPFSMAAFGRESFECKCLLFFQFNHRRHRLERYHLAKPILVHQR